MNKNESYNCSIQNHYINKIFNECVDGLMKNPSTIIKQLKTPFEEKLDVVLKNINPNIIIDWYTIIHDMEGFDNSIIDIRYHIHSEEIKKIKIEQMYIPYNIVI